jgi:D-arginine dehydrogenase
MYDFIIIGGGMAGVSVADALAPAAKVALLEAEAELGYHSTARSAALFAPAYGSTAFRILTRASEAFLDAPGAPGFPVSVLSPRGALLIARTDQAASLQAEMDSVRAAGVSIVALSGAEARERVGALRASYVAAAAYEPGVRDIDVEGLFRGFIRRARALGVEFHNGVRWHAPRWHDGLWELQLEDRELRGRVVINAAGAWAEQVGMKFGAAPLGLAVLRRSAAIIDAPPGTDVSRWPAIFDAEDQFYLKPDAGRLLISPADEEPVVPGDAYAEDVAIAVAVERIEAALDLEVRRVHRTWAGLRTFAPDRNPVIGYDARVPGFFWCAAQGGYGIQTAFAFSRAAAALARGESLPGALRDDGLTPAALSPARFAGGAGRAQD